LRNYVREHRQSEEGRAECEEQLLGFLQSEATADGKWEACRLLSSLGSKASVPILAELLGRQGSSEMARYALEKIPGDEAERALLEALRSSSGEIRLGLISSLGHRRSERAVPVLAEIAGEGREAAVEGAVFALGSIATMESADVLSGLLDSCAQSLRTSVAASLLACADALRDQGESRSALGMYARIRDMHISPSVTRAAYRGQILAAGERARDQILEVLSQSEASLHATAIRMAAQVFKDEDPEPLCRVLPGLTPSGRVQLLSVLSGLGGDRALLAAVQSLGDEETSVRMAALDALTKLGNASIVKPLIRHAANSRGAEQAAVRNTLDNLQGKAVDEAILEALSGDYPQALEGELIRCVGGRRISSGKNRLYAKLASPDPDTRILAVRALRPLSVPSDLPQLISRLLEMEDEREQTELAATLAAAARKIDRPHARAGLVVQRLRSVTSPEKRAVLLSVLGKIGDDSSLAELRRALKDPNPRVSEAAARALIEWPAPTARDDVLGIAQNQTSPTLQVLAIRAFVRLVEMERFRRPEAAVASLRAVLPLITRAEEKMAVLSVLPHFACRDALVLAESFLGDEDVREEAEAAVEQLRSALKRGSREA